MITAPALDEITPPRVSACQPDGRHAGLGARIDHTDPFNPWDSINNQSGHFQLQFRWRTEAERTACLFPDRLNHFRKGMPKDHRSPGVDHVQVAFVVRAI